MWLSSPFPAGVFNVVTGNGAFGQSLATHPDVDSWVNRVHPGDHFITCSVGINGGGVPLSSFLVFSA